MSRAPILRDEALSPEQRRIRDSIAPERTGFAEGPLRIWLLSPQLADRAQALGAFCRFDTSLPLRLSELAILVAAAYWRSGYQWHVHAPIAIEAGVAEDTIEAIRIGEPAQFSRQDEATVYALSTELLEERRLSEASFEHAVHAFGLTGVVELVCILGYYGLVAMTLVGFDVAVPAGAPKPFDAVERQ
jgi:4-carboxymuconolactone decarboxylase